MAASFIRRTSQPGGYPTAGYHDKSRSKQRPSNVKHKADHLNSSACQPEIQPSPEPGASVTPTDEASDAAQSSVTQPPSWPLTGMNHFLAQEIIRQLNASQDEAVAEKVLPKKLVHAENATHDDLTVAGQQTITLTIGVFFDGADNNEINIANMFSACKAEHFDLNDSDTQSLVARCAQENMGITSNNANSGCGYFTNIHWLNRLYKTGSTDHPDHLQQAIYVEEAGLHNSCPDNLPDEEVNITDTGIVAKTDHALNLVTDKIRAVIGGLAKNTVIKALQFDLFGFSRGAAASRHFANRIQSQDLAVKEAINQTIASTGFSSTPTITIRFIGLFDTVAAIGSPMNGLNPHSADTGEVKLMLQPGVAEKVFQITAQHECRFNFPLNSIQPEWPELALPGVHSDIGGGYLPLVREDIFLTRPEADTVPVDQPGEKTDAWQRTTRQLQMFDSAATIAPVLRTHDIATETWSDDREPADGSDRPQKRSYAAIVLRNRMVKNDWSRVTLRVMLDAAQEAGVCFNPVPQNEEALQLSAALLPLANKAIAMGKAARARQTINGFTTREIEVIARSYIHCSANWNMSVASSHQQYSGETALFSATGFIHRPDHKWLRTVYNMRGLKV